MYLSFGMFKHGCMPSSLCHSSFADADTLLDPLFFSGIFPDDHFSDEYVPGGRVTSTSSEKARKNGSIKVSARGEATLEAYKLNRD